MKIRTRFAPSPTGFMHIGNLRTALYSFLYSKHSGGEFILRIEDTDRERFVPGAVEVIYNTLKTAGITYDEGPDKGEYGPYVQSERKAIYAEYAHKLVELGGAYYCFCDKERLESLTDEQGNRRYDGHCANIPLAEAKARIAGGEPYVVRQRMPKSGVSEYDDLVFGHIAVNCEELEDNILLKSDGMPTYNFANVVDDHLMKITHVVRGTEYLSSTPKYNLIYDAFGWERPQYIHLPPIMKDAQHKLSKRYGDANFDDFTNKGYLPEAIVNYIALLGWSPKDNTEIMNMDDLVRLFTVEGINKSSSIFDETKMRWLNGEYIKRMTPEQFAAVAKPYFDASKVSGKYDYLKLSELLIPRVEILSEIPDHVNFLEEFGEYDTELFCHKKMKTDKALAKTVLGECITLCREIAEWDNQSLHDGLNALAERMQLKKGQVLWPFRIAVTGRAATPGGASEMADLLGREETLRRLEFSYKLL